ncbi:MAG: hypothetical protein QOJ25_2085 [Solirubrobacteraceae bacterium]|nr:hypothetical protein [Solirubrobacteraceae bacterium]
MRRFILAATVVASLAVGGILTTWIAGTGVAMASASTLPAEGIFETCPLDTALPTCLQRLEVMHRGGIKVVVIPAYGASLRMVATYAAFAHALGMSVMWELSNASWWQDPMTSTSLQATFGSMASACGCSENGAILRYTIHWLSRLAGTYGYYAADDSMLGPGDQAGVAAYVALIKQQDPNHTVMISANQQSQIDQYQATADLIGTEIYPVTTTSLMPVTSNASMWGNVAQTAIDAQHSADGAGKPSAFILQSFTWGDNLGDGTAMGYCSPQDTTATCYAKLRYPSAGEQLQLRNEVLEHAQAKLILWWSFPGTYGQVGSDTNTVYPTGAEAASRWSGLVSAIKAPRPPQTTHARRRLSTRAARARAARVARAARAARV